MAAAVTAEQFPLQQQATEEAPLVASKAPRLLKLRSRESPEPKLDTTMIQAKAASGASSEAAAFKLPKLVYQPLFAPGHPKYTTTIDEVPEFLRDTFIISGYRKLCYSYSACLRSMTYVHNESGNVLTHLAALVVFAGLAVSTNFNLLPAAISPGRASW
ncbi:hypothetical protein H4R22_005233, partial [Coemansia sp. RSA 1290]